MGGTPCRAHGSIDCGGAPVLGSPNIVEAPVHGSPNIVHGGYQFQLHCCEFPPARLFWGLGYLAAGCSLADSPITTGANRTCSVGLLRILTPLIPGPYVDSTCSEGAGSGQEA